MFPPWQKADLFLACWNRASAQSSEFLSCNAKWGHARLFVSGHPWHICGKWGWGAFGDHANTAHCFCGSDTNLLSLMWASRVFYQHPWNQHAHSCVSFQGGWNLTSWPDAFGKWKDRASGRRNSKTSQEAFALSGWMPWTCCIQAFT